MSPLLVLSLAGVAAWLFTLLLRQTRNAPPNSILAILVPAALALGSWLAMGPAIRWAFHGGVLGQASVLVAIAGGLLLELRPADAGGGDRQRPHAVVAWGLGAAFYLAGPAFTFVDDDFTTAFDAAAGAIMLVTSVALMTQAAWRAFHRLRNDMPVPHPNRWLSSIGGTALLVIAAILALHDPFAEGVTDTSGLGSYSSDIGSPFSPSSSASAGEPAGSAAPAAGSLLISQEMSMRDGSIWIRGGSSDRTLGISGAGATWSPDARRIAFIRKSGETGSQVCVAAADGSSERCLGTVNGYLVAPTWSSDGQTIYACNAPQLLQASLAAFSVADGRVDSVLPLSEAVSVPTVSPDGMLLAYNRGTDFSAGISPPPEELRVLDLASREPRTLFTLDRDESIAGMAWASDGQSLLVSVGRGTTRFHIERVSLDGDRETIGDEFTVRFSVLRMDGDGRLLMMATPTNGGMSELWAFDLSSGDHDVVSLDDVSLGFFDVSR